MKNKFTKDPYKRGIQDGIKYARKQGVVEVYAGFVIALHEIGYSEEEIQTILENCGKAWRTCVYEDKNIIKLCKEITGIDVAYELDKETE